MDNGLNSDVIGNTVYSEIPQRSNLMCGGNYKPKDGNMLCRNSLKFLNACYPNSRPEDIKEIGIKMLDSAYNIFMEGASTKSVDKAKVRRDLDDIQTLLDSIKNKMPI